MQQTKIAAETTSRYSVVPACVITLPMIVCGNDASDLAESAMLGGDGKGFDIMMGTVLPLFNVLNAACSVGLMEAAEPCPS